MSLGTCRDCGLQVSTAAASCPRCGRVFGGAPQKTATSTAFVLLVILIGIGFLAYAHGHRSPSEIAADAERSADADVRVAVEIQLKARMRDPESVQFQNEGVYRGGGAPVLCGEVNGKNGFGGYSGFRSFIGNGGKILLVAGDIPARSFQKIWTKVCR